MTKGRTSKRKAKLAIKMQDKYTQNTAVILVAKARGCGPILLVSNRALSGTHRLEDFLSAIADSCVICRATPEWKTDCQRVATGALESAWRIQKGQAGYRYIMSEQYLVNCDKTEQNDGCSGGWPAASFKFLGFVAPNRMPLAFTVPYEGREGMCVPNTQYGFKVLSVEESNGDETRLMDLLAQGPTTVCIDATEFALYKSGIINKADCFTQTNHCVLAVGYDKDAGHWILKNSWGSQWGEGGFVRVARGSNMCGVADYGVRPLISRTIVAPDY